MVLGPCDPLPLTTRRILITGPSGAGKSALRETISETLHLPTVEIDSLYHGPNWTPRPAFADDVDQLTSGPAWVIEWQYAQVRSLLLSRADALIWLDHGRWTVTQRVVRRTLGTWSPARVGAFPLARTAPLQVLQRFVEHRGTHLVEHGVVAGDTGLQSGRGSRAHLEVPCR